MGRNEDRDTVKVVEAHREVGETVKTQGKSGTGGLFPDRDGGKVELAPGSGDSCGSGSGGGLDTGGG